MTTTPQNVERRQDTLSNYQPRTQLGKRLLALRQAFIESGGQPLSAEALDERFDSRQAEVSSAMLLAEKSLAEDWLRPEEDEAWAHLQ